MKVGKFDSNIFNLELFIKEFVLKNDAFKRDFYFYLLFCEVLSSKENKEIHH